MMLKVATYNIHAGIGHDKQFDMHRITAVINELDADIIALQEVEHQLIDDQLLLQFLETYTDYKVISDVTFKRDNYDYGNVLLSKQPLTDVIYHDLSVAGREPRSLIEAQLVFDDKKIIIMATHLGLRPFERRFQVQKVLSLLAARRNQQTIFMGDLNEWFLWGRPHRWLKKHFKQSNNLATFPARYPVLCLDKIWVSPANSLIKVEVHRSSLAKLASDHLPIIAQIEII
jgi:endonuclease/exonuclease/phosphatase family metal-dependent hydrolase